MLVESRMEQGGAFVRLFSHAVGRLLAWILSRLDVAVSQDEWPGCRHLSRTSLSGLEQVAEH